ncbi:MAG: hypothetical protein R3Y58_12885 [Eubacteriales bacterium]
MSTALQISLIVLVVVIIACVILYFFGKKAQTRQEESEKQMEAISQTVPLLVIDKKRMKLKNAGLPAIVLEKTPFYLRLSKVPIVKAKIGPKVMTFMCDAKVYDLIPLKKEVKADISGIYITGVKGIRGPIEVPVKKKKKWFSKK